MRKLPFETNIDRQMQTFAVASKQKKGAKK